MWEGANPAARNLGIHRGAWDTGPAVLLPSGAAGPTPPLRPRSVDAAVVRTAAAEAAPAVRRPRVDPTPGAGWARSVGGPPLLLLGGVCVGPGKRCSVGEGGVPVALLTRPGPAGAKARNGVVEGERSGGETPNRGVPGGKGTVDAGLPPRSGGGRRPLEGGPGHGPWFGGPPHGRACVRPAVCQTPGCGLMDSGVCRSVRRPRLYSRRRSTGIPGFAPGTNGGWTVPDGGWRAIRAVREGRPAPYL